jgi:hypothetical protein
MRKSASQRYASLALQQRQVSLKRGDVDGYCHIDLDCNPTRLISQWEEERILTIAVTTTPRAFAQNRTWTAESRYVHAPWGCIPNWWANGMAS